MPREHPASQIVALSSPRWLAPNSATGSPSLLRGRPRGRGDRPLSLSGLLHAGAGEGPLSPQRIGKISAKGLSSCRTMSQETIHRRSQHGPSVTVTRLDRLGRVISQGDTEWNRSPFRISSLTPPLISAFLTFLFGVIGVIIGAIWQQHYAIQLEEQKNCNCSPLSECEPSQSPLR